MKISEKGQSLVEYTLILLLVATVTILSIGIYTRNIARDKFDDQFAAGNINLVGQEIKMGEVGHPLESAEIREVPYGSDVIASPREWLITGCETIYLRSEFSLVYVAAPILADQITVQIPLESGNNILVCGPKPLSDVPIYIWAE